MKSTTILIKNIKLQADVFVPTEARGLVIFVHGSGSNRHSPRNCSIAKILNKADFATILADLLTPEETNNVVKSPDASLISERVLGITKWVNEQPSLKNLPIALIGSSFGGGIALKAAAEQTNLVKTVILRGGRSDLVDHETLQKINIPVLFIVGEYDEVVQEINRNSARSITSEYQLKVVSGASHLFEEPGTLEEAANLALWWLNLYCILPTKVTI